MNKEILQTILPEENIFDNEILSGHTTLHIGGPAKFYVLVNTENELISLLELLEKENEKYYLLGNGSNILVSDEGYDGVIIRLQGELADINVSGTAITAGAGALLSAVSRKALDSCLTGMEFAAGIPGTVGGALVMNAGAYGGEMKDIVVSARILEKENGSYSVKQVSVEELNFSYRHSIAKEKDIIYLSMKVNLSEGVWDEILSNMNELSNQRREKQPLEYPSAGSTFKRPEGYFAAKLISDAGLKGYTVGGAQVSEKHAGFCINKSGASSQDFYQLMQDVRKKVLDEYGVELEPEVIMLGEF